MKKKDIIQLVKEAIKETTFYGNRHQRSSISGLPGVWEGESTSFKVVNIDTGKTIDFGLDQAKAEEIVISAKENNINAEVVKMKDVNDVGKLDEAGPSNNPYYNNLVKKAEEMGIHVNDLMKSLLKDKSEMEIVKMGYQDLAALAGVENLSEFKQPKTFDSDTIRLVREMLKAADIYHNDLVGGYDEVSSYLDERTGGTIIKFPHFNGPQGRGALFGKETSDQIDSSKAKAKAAALKTYTQFKAYIADKGDAYEISEKSPAGVYGNIYLWVMFNKDDKSGLNAKDYTAPKGGTQSSQFEMHDFEKKYGDKIKADDFKNNEKLQPGKKVTYLGTSRTIAKNNGFILTLDNGTTVNLSQFNQKGAIKEKDMKEALKVSKNTDKSKSAELAKQIGTTVTAVQAAIDAAKTTGQDQTVAEDEMNEEPTTQDIQDAGMDNLKIGAKVKYEGKPALVTQRIENSDGSVSYNLDYWESYSLYFSKPGEGKKAQKIPSTDDKLSRQGIGKTVRGKLPGPRLEEDEMDEISYDDSGLKNPKAADISKDGEISDYEQKRGLAIQNAMDDQEKNEMHTNDIGKDDYVDDEGRMAKSQMYKTGKYAMKLHDMLDDMEQLPAWVQAKLTKASDYLSAVYHYLDYEFVRRDSNLMEHVDKHKKRDMLMEGAMKKFFEMFDKGKTDEEIVQDYAQKGTQVPEPFVKRARNQYEGMKKLKLELEMSEKEFRNSSEKMVNNAEEGMESPMEEKQLASRLK